MSGDGVDGGDSSGGPPPEVPPEIGGGNQTTSPEHPSIPKESGSKPGTEKAQVPEIPESSEQQPVEGLKPGIVPIERLEMHKGLGEPADPSIHILTNEEARYAAASLAVRTGDQKGEPISPREAEAAVADGLGTTRESSGFVDVKVPGPGTPAGAGGIEVKVTQVEKPLDKVASDDRFRVIYGTYPPSESTDWTKNSDPNAIAEKLYEDVQSRKAETLAEKGIAPGLVTVLAIPYNRSDGTAQFFQFNDADVLPPRTQLGWRFSDADGTALQGFNRDTGQTVISWNHRGGQLTSYVRSGDAIANSDIFSRVLPEDYQRDVRAEIQKLFPTLNPPRES